MDDHATAQPASVTRLRDGYDAHRERSLKQMRAVSKAGRDIGTIPEVVDPERRARAVASFRVFCETYFPQTFRLAWSADHLRVIERIETAVLKGGLFAFAMPRGSGKTTLCEIACIWAVLTGARAFVVLIGASEDAATKMLNSIKVELEVNDLLLEDFPEAIYPIRCLEGITQRAGGQLCDGKPTHVSWKEKEIVLPSIEGSVCSGAIIQVTGITGRLRGRNFKRPDGKQARPSLVLIDDPQTRESAESPRQCAMRERILAGDILYMAGPGQKIAALMPCTVVREEDMADRILDREKHPEWQGERTKMVYSFPKNERLWREYAEIMRDSLRNDGSIDTATAYYLEHRDAMDEGSSVAWDERFNEDEISAIQHAMNLRYQDEHAFFAEYQNEPLPEHDVDDELLTAEEIANKTNGLKRAVVPLGCDHVTMFIDVQGKCLFWLVAAWGSDFTGAVIDYGTEPDQKMPYFALREVKRTLKRAAPGSGMEGAIYAGLERLTGTMMVREWPREDGAMMRVDRCLIDANWGESTDVVYQFCRQCPHAGNVLPSHGKYVGASSIPFAEYRRKRGDRVGHHWRIPGMSGKRAIRHVLFDTNYWKTFVQQRLATSMGDPGCLSLFGRSERGSTHRMLSEHLTAEFRVKTEGRGRTVDEWKVRAGGLDNHWLDCLVGAAVAASIQGAATVGMEAAAGGQRRKRRKVRLSDVQEARP